MTIKSPKGNGPFGRYAPGTFQNSTVKRLSLKEKANIEAIFDLDITSDGWRRIQDVFENFHRETSRKIPLAQWKKRNTRLRERIECGLSVDDDAILNLARALQSNQSSSPAEWLRLMNREIHSDEERARKLKEDGQLYARDSRGNPVHHFCWIEALHPQTEALVSFHQVFHELCANVSFRNPKGLTKYKNVPSPTPFEEFCLRYVFECDLKAHDDGGDAFFAHLQRINHAITKGKKWGL